MQNSGLNKLVLLAAFLLGGSEIALASGDYPNFAPAKRGGPPGGDAGFTPAGYDLISPYDGIDWGLIQQYKAALHVHTTESDGESTVSERVRQHADAGFDALAITDHDFWGPTVLPTWRWEDYPDMEEEPEWVEEIAGVERSAFYPELGPRGMLAIKGNEISDPHHICSFFNDAGWKEITEHDAFKYIGDNQGLAYFAHPSRYELDYTWYREFFNAYPHLLGMAVFNKNVDSDDRILWDDLLTYYGKDRPIYGFSESDVHLESIEAVNTNWQIILAEDHSIPGAIRQAMTQGRMFWVKNDENSNHDIGVWVRGISTAGDDYLVSLDLEGAYHQVYWKYNGATIATGPGFYQNQVIDNQSYVRFEIWVTEDYPDPGPSSIVMGSQPFYLIKRPAPSRRPGITDFDGDGTSDIAIFRKTSGLWAIRSITRTSFGSAADSPVPGDYNGDGTTDIAVFRETAGLWAVRGVTRFYFGRTGDLPVRVHYDEDGDCEPGIFRGDRGLWAIRGVTRVYFGIAEDVPVPGYYGPGGEMSIGIFRPSSGLWAIQGVTRTYFGASGDTTVPGDYDGAGTWSPAIFRPSSGLWAVRGITRTYFGASGDLPVPGGYVGDGPDDIGIFRPASGLWAIQGVTRTNFGGSSDVPVTR